MFTLTEEQTLFTAGFHKACISPPTGTRLAGFAGRERLSEGIHDDLFVRAMVLATDRTAVAIASAEVLALSGEFVARARAEAASLSGLDPASILIAATHTHSGPSTLPDSEEGANPAYMDSLATAIAQCIAAAYRERFPARIGAGSVHVPGIGINRLRHEGPVDDEAGIVKIEDAGGRTRAVLINFGCHPTVLGATNLLVTGDFPSAALARIEEEAPAFAMFLNGAQGDIRFGRGADLTTVGGVSADRTFSRAEQLGRQLAAPVLATLPAIATGAAPALGVARTVAELPLKKYPPLERTAALLRKAETRLARFQAQGAASEPLRRAQTERLYAAIEHANALEYSRAESGRLPIELQALRLDDTMLLAAPAELFAAIGLRLKKRFQRRTFVAGLANGYIGYLPSLDARHAGGYEVIASKCSPEAEEALVAAAIELERELFPW